MIGRSKLVAPFIGGGHASGESKGLGSVEGAARTKVTTPTPNRGLLQLQGIRGQIGSSDEKLARKIDRALRVGDRQANLIETLLDVSRIASGRLRLTREPFDLDEAVSEVVERLREAATNAGCELCLRVEGTLRGHWDHLRIEQVLMNLISNSIKYAAGQPIEVIAARDDDMAVLQVEDKGPGIPEDELSRIFERFERAASTRHYGGLGLGLYVARQIVEAHGGTIVASNRPEGGASLTVRLPLRPSSSGHDDKAKTDPN